MTLAETELEMFEKYHQQAEEALNDGRLDQACRYLQAAKHWIQLFESTVGSGKSNFYTLQDAQYLKSKLSIAFMDLSTQLFLQGAHKLACTIADYGHRLWPQHQNLHGRQCLSRGQIPS